MRLPSVAELVEEVWEFFFGKGGRCDFDTGRSHTKHSGEFDAYCMDVAPIEFLKVLYEGQAKKIYKNSVEFF